MNTNKKFKIIAISRQFGSGGRTIGKLLSEQLDIPLYDREIISHVAKESGFAESYIEEKGEYGSSDKASGMSSTEAVTLPPRTKTQSGISRQSSSPNMPKKNRASSSVAVPTTFCVTARTSCAYSFTPIWKNE